MLEVTTLASGSSGNCLLVTDGNTRLLVDAGISARRICKGLRELDIEPTDLSGIIVTHEHSDHVTGLATLTKQFHLPIYTTNGTAHQLTVRTPILEDVLHTFPAGACFALDGLEINSFATPHDVPESVGYTITGGGRKASVVTDLGYVTDTVASAIRGSDILVAETNHEPDWVRTGPYPYYLKQRILGDHGHLSNEAGAHLVCSAVEDGTRTVVLAHLSAENNTPAQAYDTVCSVLSHAGARIGQDVSVVVAPRSETGPRLQV